MRENPMPPMAGTFAMLTGLTVASWAMFETAAAPGVATSAVILIACLKIRLVFVRFMELRWSVRPWRQVFEVWSAAVTLVILGGYWYAAGLWGG